MSSVKCEWQNVQCNLWSTKFAVKACSIKWAVKSVKCKLWSLKWAVKCIVRHAMQNVQCKVSCKKFAVDIIQIFPDIYALGNNQPRSCQQSGSLLHCTKLPCTALQYSSLYCTTRHCTALHCNSLHCTVQLDTAPTTLHQTAWLCFVKFIKFTATPLTALHFITCISTICT